MRKTNVLWVDDQIRKSFSQITKYFVVELVKSTSQALKKA